jgi:hypothetical protein
LFHGLSDRPAEPGIGKRGTAVRGQFPVEPGRAVMADLLVKAGGRQDADADVGVVPRQIVGSTALDKVGGNAPVVRVDTFSMTSPAQRLQPADVGTNEGLGISA